MAMFWFPHNELVLLLIVYSLIIIQHGIITNSITVGASLGNIVIPGNFLQIKRPPVTRLLISQPHVPHYLPCSASINYDPYDNDVRVDGFIYIWYRNGIELKTFAPRRNDFQVLHNGTLRLPTNEKATGVYRCLVNATAWGHHAILSESCSVEYPILKRISSQSNITAIRGEPITLSCPVESIPTANVSWMYGNHSIERKLKENRFITLTNGSLVLINVTDTDRGKYKCVARNSYAVKTHRQFILTVSVAPPYSTNNLLESSAKYKLLPPLQDDVHYIPSKTNLQLRCIGTTNLIVIEWWFQKTLESQPEKLSNNSRDFQIRDASVIKNDGYYSCTTKHDTQMFQVIVTDPPKIVQPLESYESSLAAFVNFSCSAEGNPKPEFEWYHNGEPLSEDSYTTNIQRNVLTIQSFDLANEGIYQCFAQNIAGETYSAALLRLSQREDLDIMPKSLKNVRCYAMNFNTINVTFHSGTSLYFISVHFVQKDPYVWESRPPLQLNHSEYVVISGHMPIYKPFVILIRALLPISFHKQSNKESIEETMQSSFLSDAAFCCTQGLPIRAFFLSSDVFITWSNPAVKTKYFVVQLSIAFTRPHPQEFFKESFIQGISSSITIMRVPDDIEDNLQDVIPLTESQAREVLSRAQTTRNESEEDDDVFSMIVPSNVTGLLLKNCLRAKVRVLVITNENENLQQDFQFVQWKIIENDAEGATTVPFRVLNIEPRSVSFIFADSFKENCVQVCYFVYEIPDFGNSRRICQDMAIFSSTLVLRELKPRKHYRALFYSCNNHYAYGEVDVQTLPDPPGTVTNHRVSNEDGVKLSWDPPTNPNGKIHHYSILWTVYNATHEANISSTETFFKFPNITDREKINVTVRVVGENGIGAPIFIDLRNLPPFVPKKTSLLDTYLGVAIGAALSSLCILVFSLIFICQRHRFKLRSGQIQLTSQSESNIGAVSTPGGGTETTGLGGFLGESGLSGGLGESSTLHEYHEMQTLIPKSQNFQFVKDMPPAPKQLPNGNGNCPRRNENSSECIFAETDFDEELNTFCSSTPNSKASPKLTNNDDDALYFIPVGAKNHRKNLATDYPNSIQFSDRFALNKISSSPNFFNGGISSVSGGCRPLDLTEDCSRQRHNNRHSQRQPAVMQNGCSHYVNTTNNKNSNSSCSNNSKINQQQPPQKHPTHQLKHSIENGLASLSEPKLFATINNGERNPDSMNHVLFPDLEFHPTKTYNLDRNDENLKACSSSPTAINNNNTLSWHNKQQSNKLKHDQHQNFSIAPLIDSNSTIGSEVSSPVVDSNPSISGPSLSLNHHLNQEPDSSRNPLLKTNWNHRRPNVDPNG